MQFKRAIAIFLASSLTLDLVHAGPLAPISNSSAFSIELPSHLGSIADSFKGHTQSDQPDIILIQDLHVNRSVQFAISALLKHLKTQNLLPTQIAVEGASGLMDIHAMQAYPEAHIRKAAADYLVEQGEMPGAMHFAVTEGQGQLVGVETEEVYKANLEVFQRTYAQRRHLKEELEILKSTLPHLRRDPALREKTELLLSDIDAVMHLVSAQTVSDEIPATLHRALGSIDRLKLVLPKEASDSLLETLSAGTQFYTFALMRDEDLFKNTVALHQSARQKTTVLIAGGFHTKGFIEQCKANGLSYVVITPTVQTMDRIDETLYTERLLGHHLTSEQIAQGLDWAAMNMLQPFYSLTHGALDVWNAAIVASLKPFRSKTSEAALVGVVAAGLAICPACSTSKKVSTSVEQSLVLEGQWIEAPGPDWAASYLELSERQRNELKNLAAKSETIKMVVSVRGEANTYVQLQAYPEGSDDSSADGLFPKFKLSDDLTRKSFTLIPSEASRIHRIALQKGPKVQGTDLGNGDKRANAQVIEIRFIGVSDKSDVGSLVIKNVLASIPRPITPLNRIRANALTALIALGLVIGQFFGVTAQTPSASNWNNPKVQESVHFVLDDMQIPGSPLTKSFEVPAKRDERLAALDPRQQSYFAGNYANNYDQGLTTYIAIKKKDKVRALNKLRYFADQDGIPGTSNLEAWQIFYGEVVWVLGIPSAHYVHDFGTDPAPEKLMKKVDEFTRQMLQSDGRIKGGPSVEWAATEHALDALAYLTMRYQLTHSPEINRMRMSIAHWLVNSAYIPSEKRFRRGQNDSLYATYATDVHAWAVLVFLAIKQDDPAFFAASGLNQIDLDGVLASTEKVFDTAMFVKPNGSSVQVPGFRFSPSGPVSVEWSWEVAQAQWFMGHTQRAETIAAGLERARLPGGKFPYALTPGHVFPGERVAGTFPSVAATNMSICYYLGLNYFSLSGNTKVNASEPRAAEPSPTKKTGASQTKSRAALQIRELPGVHRNWQTAQTYTDIQHFTQPLTWQSGDDLYIQFPSEYANKEVGFRTLLPGTRDAEKGSQGNLRDYQIGNDGVLIIHQSDFGAGPFGDFEAHYGNYWRAHPNSPKSIRWIRIGFIKAGQKIGQLWPDSFQGILKSRFSKILVLGSFLINSSLAANSTSNVLPVRQWILNDAYLMCGTCMVAVILGSVLVYRYLSNKSPDRDKDNSHGFWLWVGMMLVGFGLLNGLDAYSYFSFAHIRPKVTDVEQFSTAFTSLERSSDGLTSHYLYMQKNYSKAVMDFSDRVVIKTNEINLETVNAINITIPIGMFNDKEPRKEINIQITKAGDHWITRGGDAEGLTLKVDKNSLELEIPFVGIVRGKQLIYQTVRKISVVVHYNHSLLLNEQGTITLERIGPPRFHFPAWLTFGSAIATVFGLSYYYSSAEHVNIMTAGVSVNSVRELMWTLAFMTVVFVIERNKISLQKAVATRRLREMLPQLPTADAAGTYALNILERTTDRARSWALNNPALSARYGDKIHRMSLISIAAAA